MAHYATNRYSYWGQLGLLAAFTGAGVVLGAVASMIPLLGVIDLASKESFAKQMDNILRPENAGALRLSQTLATLFMFLAPVLLYARLCHVKALQHLGFKNSVNWKQAGLAMLIMLACLPAVDLLQELTKMLPWSKASLQRFDEAEAVYFKTVTVMARMNDGWDYILSLLVVALAPAVMEEVLFRGGLQNLLSRWIKMPILAIVITSILFSAVHGSYLGFLSRFALGFILGWMYYRTGNIWLNIIAHFFNNAAAVTQLYIFSKPGQKIDASLMDTHAPWWMGIASVAVLTGLLIAFDKVGKKEIDRPGQEVLIPGYSSNPFDNDIALQQSSNQQ